MSKYFSGFECSENGCHLALDSTQLDLQPTVSMMRTTFQTPLLPLLHNQSPKTSKNPIYISAPPTSVKPVVSTTFICRKESLTQRDTPVPKRFYVHPEYGDRRISCVRTLDELAKLSRPPLLTSASLAIHLMSRV